MSNFSGKFDVKDWFSDRSDDYVKNCEIYYGDLPIPLRIENHHDLAPFYPFLVTTGSHSDGKDIIHISTSSFVDHEEKERLTWTLDALKKYWRKCKRNKIPYDAVEALEAVRPNLPYHENDEEMANRVGLYGDKATIDGIHDDMHEYYRNKLLEEMIRLGWEERTAKYWIWKDWRCLVEDVKTQKE